MTCCRGFFSEAWLAEYSLEQFNFPMDRMITDERLVIEEQFFVFPYSFFHLGEQLMTDSVAKPPLFFCFG